MLNSEEVIKDVNTRTMDAVREMLLRPVHAVSSMLDLRDRPQYRLHVVTGDRRGAGTDANVYVVVHDINGRASTPILSNKVFRNDNERGATTTVDISADLGLQGPITKVEVWRDNFADIKIFSAITGALFGQRSKRGSASWFLDRIEVEEVDPQNNNSLEKNDKLDGETEENGAEKAPETAHIAPGGGRVWVFPLQRWVVAHKRYTIHLHDCFLPQDDPDKERRDTDVQGKRELYRYAQKVEDGPAQVNMNAKCHGHFEL